MGRPDGRVWTSGKTKVELFLYERKRKLAI